MYMKVIIASKNPVKIACVQEGFGKVFPDNVFEFEGVTVPSQVAEQPMSDAETLQGAMNRVKNAQQEIDGADFYVGIEGGVAKVGDEIHEFAWIVVSGNGVVGKAKAATFILPPVYTKYLEQGMEVGHISDLVFGTENSKQDLGASGLLSNGALDRKNYYIPAVILACLPFVQPELYTK